MSTSFTTTITVAATPQKTFDAINDVSGWWGPITGLTTATGDEFVYLVPDVHYCGFRVTDTVAGRRIAWLVTGSYLAFFADKQEWTGTSVRFDMDEIDHGTRITFTHEGLHPEDECYDLCSNSWSTFVNGSLKAFIETGEGAPYSPVGGETLADVDRPELQF